jgi:hypothetical protein
LGPELAKNAIFERILGQFAPAKQFVLAFFQKPRPLFSTSWWLRTYQINNLFFVSPLLKMAA